MPSAGAMMEAGHSWPTAWPGRAWPGKATRGKAGLGEARERSNSMSGALNTLEVDDG